MRRVLALAGIVSSCPAHYLAGQSPLAPPPAPLLQRLVGQWTMTGTVRTRPVSYRLEGAWVLQGRFLDAFHDTFVYDSRSDTWTIHLDAADGAGGWKGFAEYRAGRRRGVSQ